MAVRLILLIFDCQGLVICQAGEGETQSQVLPENGFPGQRPSSPKQRVKWRLRHHIQSNNLPSVSVSHCLRACVCVREGENLCVHAGVCRSDRVFTSYEVLVYVYVSFSLFTQLSLPCVLVLFGFVGFDWS